MKKIKQLCILLLMMIGIWSCDTSNMFIGGGIAPDISAPELTITYPANLAYESGNFAVAGTAVDNIKVTKVELAVYRNGTALFDKNNLPQASISGNQWSYKFSKLESGEYSITATAYDKAGNVSEYSSKSIVITVDNEQSTILIQKPNLKPQATLETLDYRDYTYIEYFQNKTFSVRGSVDDEYPLKEITLQLLNGTECVYSLTFDLNSLNDESLSSMIQGSLYNWTVTINSEEKPVESEKYTNKLASLSATDKHYLKVNVIVTDRAGNKTADSKSVQGFICLYQEADRPWAVVSSLVGGDTSEAQLEKNKLHSGAQITGSAYDDDLLDTIEFCIADYNDDKLVMHPEVLNKSSFGETGCTVWSVPVPSNQGQYRLYYRLKDSNGTPSYDNGDETGWNKEHSVCFQVIDESAPVTEMTPFEDYPESAYASNENPAFKINGITRDSAGISQVILAWDPDASSETAALLRKDKWDITESGYHDGVKYWLVDLTNDNIQENNAFKMVWSCELPVSDFVDEDEKPVFALKKMYYCTISESKNWAVGAFPIPKERNEPKLEITSPQDGAICRNVGGERFTIAGTCKDMESGVASLVIKYKTSSGDERKYDVLANEKLAADGNWSVTSDLLKELGGSYQRITVEARDFFGNPGMSSVDVKVDDNSPQVTTIAVDNEGRYYSTGETLTFSVTMNREVEVKGDGIILELNCNKDVNGNPVYARYKGIDETNKILKFDYTVKSGDEAEPLDYVSQESLKLRDGTSVTGKVTDGNASSSAVPALLGLPTPGESGSLAARGVFIDTGKPYVKQITADVGEGAYKAGDVIKIFAQFNENINGRAKIFLNSREKTAENYVQMNADATNTDTLEFVYTVKAGDNTEALDIFAPFYAYDESTTVTDAAGNEMDFNNFPKEAESGSLANLKIKIDTTEPQLKGVYVCDVSTPAYDDGKYYLNNGKTITFEAEFSEAVMLASMSPYLEFNASNNSKKVQAQYKSGAGTSILSFTYTVADGDNSTADLACNAFVGDVTDVAGNGVLGSEGNKKEINEVLKKVTRSDSTSYSDISIVIDTTKPQPPTFNFVYVNDGSSVSDFTQNGNTYTGKTTGYIENIKVTANAASGETTSVMKIFASAGGQTKQDWNEQSSFSTDTDNAEQIWKIQAQLTDYAGNISDISTASFMVDKGVPLLSAITTTLTNGLYKSGTEVPVTLVFSKKVNAVKSGSGNIEIAFNNGAKAVITPSTAYSARYKAVYTVGENDSDTDKLLVDKLLVTKISGAKFSDTAGNAVAPNSTNGYGIATSNDFADDFTSKAIQIDKTAPTIVSYSVQSISDETHSDNGNYYLNAEKNVRIAVTFSEAVMISGDSFVTLSNGKNATYTGTSDNKTTLYYIYSIVSGDSATALSIKANVYPANIQDTAGNPLSAGIVSDTVLKHKSKNIAVDTTAPAAPTVKVLNNNAEVADGSTVNNQVTLNVSGETGAEISYSVNGGSDYEKYTSDVVLGDTGSKKTYYIVAKQVDKAGNVSKASTKISVTVDLQEMGISKISTTKVDGTYKAGDTIPIILLFTKKVSYSDLKITLNSGKDGKELSSSSSGAALSHQIDYKIEAGDTCETATLKVTKFEGTFTGESGDVTETVKSSFGALKDNFAENKIYIDTTAPTITGYSVESISDTEHSDTGNYYVNASDTVTIKVTFSENVTGIGTSNLPLNSGESAVYSSGYGSDTLTYVYTIKSGNAAQLKVNANVYPTNLQDMAGNALSGGKTTETALQYNSKNIVVDTVSPQAPVVAIKDTNGNTLVGSSTTTVAKMTIAGETNATLQYSVNAGSSYSDYSAEVSLPADSENKSLNEYKIMAKQTDLAGNESAPSALKTLTVDLRPIGIKAISTTKPGGVYKAGSTIPLTIEFHKAITSTGDITLTLSNNATVKFTASGRSVYTLNYVVSSTDKSTDALYVKSIQGTIKDTNTGNWVTSFEGLANGATISEGEVSGNIHSDTPNLEKSGDSEKVVAIDTVNPTITSYSVTTIIDTSGTEHSDSSNYYLNTGDYVKIAVAFDEVVAISGDSSITLSNGKKATYTGASADNKTLYYTYTVGSNGDTSTALSIGSNVYPSNVQDRAGNTLSAGKTTATVLQYSNKNIVVDITCAAPTLTGITGGTIYNAAKDVTLGGETSATFYYSYDGGATETKLASGNSFTIPEGEGRYQITAYQVDIAGNKSAWATPIEIIVDTAPPTIKSISTTAGDGIYKAGDTLTITAEFSESVTGSITVNLTSGGTVTLSPNGSSNASADYTVVSGQNVKTLKVNSISGNITDTAGNSLKSSATYSNFAGKNIEIDTTAPSVTNYKVKKHGSTEISVAVGTTTQDVAVNSKIILQFNEKVSKGSGKIKVERVYKSYPAVMEVDEYNTHKAGIGSYYIQRCIGTVDNAGNAPDTNAKYVLKYDIDHGAYATNSGLSGDQKTVYNHFANTDYNVTEIDVNSGLVTETVDSTSTYSLVTVALPSELKKGIIYKVTFAAGTFVDQAGNKCAAETGNNVKFETGPTATPVIRINKVSGRGERGVDQQPYTTEVKISSEMYGAILHTGQTTNSSVTPSLSDNGINSQYELTLDAGSNTDAAIFKIWANTTKENLTAGNTSKELAYKTVIYSTWHGCYIRGSDSSGGVSATTEFPASWYESKNTARLSDDGYFVSWHILKSFQWKIIDTTGKWGANKDNIKTNPGSCGSYTGG